MSMASIRVAWESKSEDLDGDGLPELFVTNFENEYNTLYQNLGGGLFLDATSTLRPGNR